MRARSPIILLLCLACLYSGYSNAIDKQQDTVTLPNIKAKSWVLIDHDSGFVIKNHNDDQRVQADELTKLMSAYVIFEYLKRKNINTKKTLIISDTASQAVSPRIFLTAGDNPSIDLLLNAMIIRSANDATIALAEFVATDEAGFVDLMNAKAKDLGLTDSQYQNATGVEQRYHYTTAADAARLSSALIRDFPSYYKRFATKTLGYKNIEHHNRNALLWQDAQVDGLIASLNRSNGYTLVSSAKRGHMRLIAVLIGATSERGRAQDSKNLLNYGFSNYETRLLYRANVPIPNTRVRVWMGSTSILPLGIDKDLYVTIPRGAGTGLQSRLIIDDVQYAPIGLGQTVGTLKVYLNEQMIEQHALVALKEIKTGNLLQRTLDRVLHWFD